MRKFFTAILLVMFVFCSVGMAQAGEHHHGMNHKNHNPFEVSQDKTHSKHKLHCDLMGHNLQRPCPHKTRGVMDPNAPDALASDCGGLPMSSKAHSSHSGPHPLAFQTISFLQTKPETSWGSFYRVPFSVTVFESTDPPPRFL